MLILISIFERINKIADNNCENLDFAFYYDKAELGI